MDKNKYSHVTALVLLVVGHQQFIYSHNLVENLNLDEEDKIFLPNKYPSKQISIGSCNGDFTLNKIIKNLSINLKKFLEIEKTDYDNLN